MGRRAVNSKLTDQRVEAILDALRHGCTRKAAAGAANIHYTTLWRMIDGDADLRNAVETAETQAEAAYTRVIAEASVESWQAAAWWLERRKHEDYARRDKSEMTIDVKREAARIAEEMGMDVDEVLAEAQRIFADSR